MATVRYTVIQGEVVAEKRNGVRSLYVPDSLGTTRSLLDNTQTQTDTFVAWPYGETVHLTGSNPTPFTFVGTQGYHTDSSSRIYVRNRVGEPQKARWLTEDLIIAALNAYLYAHANPVRYNDPSGLYPICQGDNGSSGQSLCSDIIDPKSAAKLDDLIKCLEQTKGEASETKKCFEKYGKGITDKMKDQLIEYLGCVAGACETPTASLCGPPKNPCKPKNSKYCFECCYSKYVVRMAKCIKKSDFEKAVLCIKSATDDYTRCAALC